MQRRLVYITLVSCLSMIAFDFFLHAGVLEGIYREASSFLLAPEQAFRRIPLGYLSFLILAFLLSWLMDRMAINSGPAGWRFGLGLGLAIWGSLTLGLYSISTASWQLLLAWWLGQAAELGVAGWVTGKMRGGTPVRKMLWWVVGLMVLSIGLTVMMQNF